jgi:MiaB/RimO family radical SAM methylthiotransferase
MSHGKACVVCTGCPESRIDSATVKKFLVENGWNVTEEIEEADLLLFRACGLTNVNIEKSLQAIRTLDSRKKESARFIVWGCLPKIDQESLRTVYSGVTFGESESDVLDKILDAKKPIGEVSANSVMPLFEFASPKFFGLFDKSVEFVSNKFEIVQSKKIFQIKASTGCLDNCSFCGVKKSRGRVSSKSIDRIVSEFKDGLSKGYRYFGLLATDLGAYGKDIGCDLVELLVELTKQKGDYKIGLRNINPHHLKNMFERLRPIFASDRIWFLSSAAESGSNRILKLMGRRYSIEDFIKCFRKLNQEYPDILLRTQLMVGFPTETDEDFQMTMQLTDDVRFDWVEVYPFSPTKGTVAATMDGQVPEETKADRVRQLSHKTMFQYPLRKISKLLSVCL